VMVVAGAIALGSGGGPTWRPAVHAAAAVITALVLGTYCVLAQRALGRRNLAATLMRVPAMIAITIGISLGQARAVLEGAFGRRSEFVRTPKDGSAGGGRRRLCAMSGRAAVCGGAAGSAGVSAARRGRARRAGWLEVITAAAVASAAVAAAAHGGVLDVAFLALAAFGLAWVGLASAMDR